MYLDNQHNLLNIRYEEYLREADEARLARLTTSKRNRLWDGILLWAGERLVATGENLKQMTRRQAAPIYRQSVTSARADAAIF